ncbi:unnamed protein product, partial [Cyprideis torosa]
SVNQTWIQNGTERLSLQRSFQEEPRPMRNSMMTQLRSCVKKTWPRPTFHVQCQSPDCGRIWRPYSSTKRIVGGRVARHGDWPFLVAIQGGPDRVFYCAGALVSRNWVVTAAHCIGDQEDYSGWTLKLGVTRRTSHTVYSATRRVKSKPVVHHEYNSRTLFDKDVALLELDRPVEFHETLRPVCLPVAGHRIPVGTRCTVIGWGKSSNDPKTDYEVAINEVEVPVVDDALCSVWVDQFSMSLTDAMFCAGYEEGGKDACQGDSGGPLLCRDPKYGDRWYLGGIISWGIQCAHPRLPGVYVNVSTVVPWIRHHTDLPTENGTDEVSLS